jgi:eukaryotic-like serine/threonine-protein kinase
MTPERLRQVSRIYHAALARDREARDAFVREACGEDDALRQDVESLLAQPVTAENFLGEPAIAMAACLRDSVVCHRC